MCDVRHGYWFYVTAILIMATLETLSANFVGHFVEKSNLSQNSSTKCLDKVGDEDTRTAIMRTAVYVTAEIAWRVTRGYSEAFALNLRVTCADW